jgi:para-aminobenzoate synthetase
MNTLLIDNYDSYTYNVFHLLASVVGDEPAVVHNDMLTWRALSRWDFDAIVLSPGPGRPQRWHDFGVCADILRFSEVPVLGICLGHQGLGRVLDGTVASAPMVMHGRLSRVRHRDTGLFSGIPQDFSVVRYHSLAVSGPLGREGRVTAWTADGVVMGIEHVHRPLWGVQFHPESVASEHGHRLVANFYELAARSPHSSRDRSRFRTPPPAPSVVAGRSPASQSRELRRTTRTLEGAPDTERLFEALFASAQHSFWLDSADAPSKLGRASYMGTSAGAGHCVIEYDVSAGKVTQRRGETGATEVRRESIFQALGRELDARSLTRTTEEPGGLLGGFVGYLGYECKADCGSPNRHRSDVPDAVFMLANRMVAVDHEAKVTRLIALSESGDHEETLAWLEHATATVSQMLASTVCEGPVQTPTPQRDPGSTIPVVFHAERGRSRYLADIARCQRELAAGESYEICLTDQISTAARPEPFTLYRRLRASNPAPFAAYLRLGEDLAVVSSSPERFLSIDERRRVQARPIKGTAARSADPTEDRERRASLAGDEKTFAEHLMIVDLLRNDLGAVCEIGTVEVPELMVIEPYATVHQMASTVTGLLEQRRSAVECVRACFPGGSMTGAPKLRTMEIIDDIEAEARGVYSGALGYFGIDGVTDLSIVIRTVVLRPGRTTIGAGGAIVIQSDAEEEFAELLLKASAPMRAVADAVTGSDHPEALRVELEPRDSERDAA